MARINIEDSLFKDRRFLKLLTRVGCEYKTLGLVVSAWVLAQDNWLKYKSIPGKAWPKDLEILIEVELAERSLNGNVYVKGSLSSFTWLEQRSSAGKSKSKKKTKNLVQNNKNQENEPNGRSSFVERNPNGTEPLTLTLTPTLTPTLDLSLNNKRGAERETENNSSQTSKAVHRGCISEFEFDATCLERLKHVTHRAQNAWLIAYPNVDWICTEVRRAHAWIETNPQKAPKDFGRFMNSWLSRAFENFRKGIPSNQKTYAQKNSDALQEMIAKIDRGEL